ncbi:GNAT family N-acetyltransferase [Pseudonocardia humida]|uniref:GNAT family N-acetyltransferase n=1 Tax=Pseudonocardia humida TaxID=2800819 RepID=A0ABT0ZYW1_9PSEU|nr:GNAT family N-acetyltransferase [Pseudonocardia humida]MCO1655927.1 GNAT family N-acetyltransferase [Pseudonocardia humida]
MSAVDWSLTWEDDLDAGAHAELAGLLRRCFPRSRRLDGSRSWASARPEVRLVGRRDGRAVAHIAVLRRYLRVAGDDRDLLVGDVGLVGVDPDQQGRGTGRLLLVELAGVLDGWALPFGFLTTSDDLTGFYAAGGWARVPARTRMIEPDGRVEVYGGPSMVLPVRSPMADWPAADVVDRNGYEV